MTPTTQDIADLLETITAKAPGLRNAGVTSVSIDGVVSVHLSPADVPEVVDLEPVEDDPPDALHDRATFGGRKPPGRSRPDKEPA